MKKNIFILVLFVICTVFSGCYFSTKLNEVFEVSSKEGAGMPLKKPVLFVNPTENVNLLLWDNVDGAKSYDVLYARYASDDFVSLGKSAAITTGEKFSSFLCTESGYYKVMAVGEKSKALSDSYRIF